MAQENVDHRRAPWPLLLGVASAFALIALLGANWYHVDYPSLHGADVWLVLLATFAGLAMLVGGSVALIACSRRRRSHWKGAMDQRKEQCGGAAVARFDWRSD
jgi:hypothetical protein